MTATDIDVVRPSARAAAELYPPQLMGPTWQKGPDGSFILPERTLGWEVLRWCATWLRNPETNEPWMFTPEQARFILWLYELDWRGRRVYRQAVLQRLKGWGKDPLAACLCIVELIGPVVFDRWDDSRMGKAIGKDLPSAWVQIVAVSADQTKNTMLLIPSLIPDETRQHFRLDIQKQLIQVKGNPQRRIEAISSSFRAMEGNRPSFGIANETHHWVPSRGGEDLMLTLQNNLDKHPILGTLLAITNAYMPGENSEAEKMRTAELDVIEGRASFSGVLYDSLEAHPAAPLDLTWAPFIVDQIKGDAYWLKSDTIALALQNRAISPARLRRFWFNQIIAAEDAIYDEATWDASGVPDTKPLSRGDAIVMGFDGGKTDDATALVAIRIADRCIFPIHVWQKPDGPMAEDWQIDPDVVDAMVQMCFREFDVRAFFADVALWETWIAKWGDDFREKLRIKANARSTVGFDMRGNAHALTMSHEAMIREIKDGRLTHNGDRTLRRHALNVRGRENKYGLSYGKESRESPKKIDAYAALHLAFTALTQLSESGKNDDRTSGAFYQF